MASVAGGIAGISDSDITACINEGTVKLNSDFNTFGDIVGDPLSNSNIFASWALKGSICGGDGEKGNIINSISAISSSILEKDIEVLNEGLKLYQDKVAGEADKECSYIWGLVNNKLTLIKQ